MLNGEVYLRLTEKIILSMFSCNCSFPVSLPRPNFIETKLIQG